MTGKGITWGGIVVGVLLWAGFTFFVEYTNQMSFCSGLCHEMQSYVYAEYQQSSHYHNRSGVTPQCADCHVPRGFLAKMGRKIQATRELFVHFFNQPDTLAKFDAIRPRLAESERRRMFANGSAECKACHTLDHMKPELQKDKARNNHELAAAKEVPCITCHQNLVHKPVPKTDFIEQLEAAGRLTQGERAPPSPRPAAAPVVAAVAPVQERQIDWAGVPETQLTLLYPGQTSIEWILKGQDHGGGMAFKSNGEKCMDCHNKELAKFGDLLVLGKNSKGEVMEPTPMAGKLGHLLVGVKAAHDADNLYLRFHWRTQPGHVPAPFVPGGKLDEAHEIKLSLLVDDGQVTWANQAGCWATCHHDLRTMPDAPAAEAVAAQAELARLAPPMAGGVTKYLKESRTALEIKGQGGKKRGGWDKLKEGAELDRLLAEGVFLDLWQWRGGRDRLPGQALDGHVLAGRQLAPAPWLQAQGTFADGVYTVTMTRRLNPGGVGNKVLQAGARYTVGLAIHDDHAAARFHHVSMNYTLGLDDAEAAINAVAR